MTAMLKTLRSAVAPRGASPPSARDIAWAAGAMVLGAGLVVLGVAIERRRNRNSPALPATSDPSKRGPVTQSTVVVNPADTPMGEAGRNEEERLDEALQESFPTSDPVSVRIE
jgi:hypothetical protein